MIQPNRSYLGDGVYVAFDGNAFVLTTGHHDPAVAQNVIVLEVEVMSGLVDFIGKLTKKKDG